MTSISSAAMLVNLRISVWTARRKDKETEAHIVRDAGARSDRALSAHKNLLADAAPLVAINKFAGDCRQWFYFNTLAWDDDGRRLLPTKTFFTVKQEANDRDAHFWQLVTTFEREYPTLITAAALQLGTLFKRSEYPDHRTIADKFSFGLSFSPVPEAGDFRLDVAADALKELRASCEAEVSTRVESALRDAWERLHTTIKHMQEKLTPNDDGKTKRIHETMLTNAGELCSVLSALNITNDPKLEEARRALEGVVERTDTQSLRDSDELRASVKKKVDEIADKFAL